MAIVVLVFVVLYKLCDAFAGAMTAPFVIDLGFSRNDYAAIVKGVGLAATLIGRLRRCARARLSAGYEPVDRRVSAMASNLIFTLAGFVGVNLWALTLTLIVENFTGAIGTVIFVAYLSALLQQSARTRRRNMPCSPRSPRSGEPTCRQAQVSSPERAGWPWFFIISA